MCLRRTWCHTQVVNHLAPFLLLTLQLNRVDISLEARLRSAHARAQLPGMSESSACAPIARAEPGISATAPDGAQGWCANSSRIMPTSRISAVPESNRLAMPQVVL